MLMAAATHRVGSAHPSSSSNSISPPPSWHPVLLVPNHHHQQVVCDYDELDLATPSGPSPFPSPTPAAATASPPRPGHNQLRPAASRRRAGKPQRRPRPSRKLPTTYISADAASFRRMVHQVTGADDVPLLHLPGPAASAPEVLCRQAPAPPRSRAGLMTTETETMLLPTLDTSAFLMLGAVAGGGGGGAGRGGAAPARPPGMSCCHGSSVVAVDPGAALQVKAEDPCGGGGFPSLESWDDDDALF